MLYREIRDDSDDLRRGDGGNPGGRDGLGSLEGRHVATGQHCFLDPGLPGLSPVVAAGRPALRERPGHLAGPGDAGDLRGRRGGGVPGGLGLPGDPEANEVRGVRPSPRDAPRRDGGGAPGAPGDVLRGQPGPLDPRPDLYEPLGQAGRQLDERGRAGPAFRGSGSPRTVHRRGQAGRRHRREGPPRPPAGRRGQPIE